jgi:hypothetical protein
VKPDSGKPEEEPSPEPGSVQQEARACPVCGTKFFATADRGFCPICIFCGAASGQSAATEERGLASESGDSVEEADGTQVRRFGHYQLMLNEAGRPIELGRGAMGVNCKALDVDLRRPVTLKIISERYLGEESARLRFTLRRAHAAKTVR